MPGIVFILIMVLLVTLWIMGAYVDVKNTHRQNGHNSGSELVKTEITQEKTAKNENLLSLVKISRKKAYPVRTPKKRRARICH